MDRYFLNEDQLKAIFILNGLLNFRFIKDHAARIKRVQDTIFKDLLIKQPELKAIHDSFLESLTDDQSPNVAFGKTFSGKIHISNFIEQLFSNRNEQGNDSTRMNLLKNILENYPPFLQITHDFIKNNNQKNDSVLYDFYFQALKSKKVDKKSINSNEILKNIDSFHGNDIASNKKKINSYLSNFPKDLNLYLHIMQEMGEMISKIGSLKIFWDEKINFFTKEAQQEYKQKNISIIPWTEKETYHYNFKINSQYVIEKSQCSQSSSEHFCRVLHNCIGSFISKKFSSSNSIKENLVNNVSYVFESKEERDEAKKFCNFIGNEIDSLIKSFRHQDDYFRQSEDFNNYLEKLYMATSLNKELSNNSSANNTRIKNKI